MPNQVVWFDMPVKDLDRATRFYAAVLGADACNIIEIEKYRACQEKFAIALNELLFALDR